jgi:thymidylate synthase (FAD)
LNHAVNVEPLIKKVAHISYARKRGDLSPEASAKFIQKHVLNAGHHSLLRHAWFSQRIGNADMISKYNYFKLPNSIRQYLVFDDYKGRCTVSGTINTWMNFYHHTKVKVNPRLKEMCPTVFKEFESEGEVIDEEIPQSAVAYTFVVDGCSRLFTHQQVRHTHNFAYNQESTRYVSYKNGFDMVIPENIHDKIQKKTLYGISHDYEENYNYLISNGVKKEDARFFLPNGIKSKIAITMRHDSLFGQYKKSRAEGKTGKPSNEIQSVAREMIRIIEENEKSVD